MEQYDSGTSSQGLLWEVRCWGTPVVLQPVILSGGGDGIVRVWDPNTGDSIREPLSGHSDEVGCVASGRINDLMLAVSGSWDETVRLWDLNTGSSIGGPLSGHTAGVAAVAIAEVDARPVILSGGGDETVRVWSLGGEAISVIEIGSAIWGIASVRPGRVVIAASLGVVFIEFTQGLWEGGSHAY
jgi:WD40 repeat protein